MSKLTNWPTTDRYFYKSLLNTNDILHLLTKKLNFAPKPIGKSVFFLCPFHDDKNPSLSFEPQKKIFTCFSCSFKANDIFDFWTQYKKISFEAALEEISQLGFSEKITPLLIQKKKAQEQEVKDKPFDLLSLISDIYQHNLFTLAGKEVRNYLTQRQVDYPLINRFGLGASINNWQITSLFYNKSEKATKNLLLANLIWAGENKPVIDYFVAQQLIIPLTDTEGRVVAFAARQIESVSPAKEVSKFLPKYKYLPSYQYYHKSALLYNYLTAKKSRAEECYVVEGFFDVISLTKAGIENCVALLGTNLTLEQMKLLTNLKKRIVLFLDSDEAGQLATVNIALQLLKQEIDCEMVKLEHQGDPDEICRQLSQSQEEFNYSETEKEPLSIQKVLQKREKPYLFILHYYFNKWEIKENPQRIKHFVSEIALLFQRFKINIRQFLVEKISQLVNWEKGQVETYFIPRYFPIPHFSQIKHYGQTIIQTLEKKIISLCFQERFFWLLVITEKYFFNHPVNRKNWQNLHYYYASLGEQNPVNQPVLEREMDKLAKELSKPEEDIYQKKRDEEKILTLNRLFQKIAEVKLFIAKI
ncbi:MAG: toprim domain-containing protein [Candidatus Moeniiplasma glomeromycotorum]|nr:toprim domain-containing protein [Candidatus Moeniiplasma glomeromycotorum]MCE8162173.1 toprim domain-containing protein [Candidatus Moeniiplasma glomeromycotorum]MCE8166172.1 toprim domain-containing protein [Candidatus Moeniiplasma glomeromycotorum]MCE8166572.1 toprim domain-containing protein [Candidatus Moeniiplasma glomeromycotorum]